MDQVCVFVLSPVREGSSLFRYHFFQIDLKPVRRVMWTQFVNQFIECQKAHKQDAILLGQASLMVCGQVVCEFLSCTLMGNCNQNYTRKWTDTCHNAFKSIQMYAIICKKRRKKKRRRKKNERMINSGYDAPSSPQVPSLHRV